MRQDYAYIAKNTSLCLTTTEKGNTYCDTLPDEEVEETTDTLNELLLLVQDTYVLIEDNSDIDGWVTAIDKIYKESYDSVNPGITIDVIIDALSKGYLGLRVVIWD